MSTLKATNIKNDSSASNNIVLDSGGGVVVSGVTTVSAGSASAPSITPTGDSNTGIFFPSADTIAFSEGGAEVARFDSSGRFGLGTNNPESLFHINGDATAFRITRGSSIGFAYNTGTSATDPFRIQSNGGSVDLYSAVSQPITFSAGTTEKARIDGSGRLLVGTITGSANLTLIGDEDQRFTNSSVENVRKRSISHRYTNLSTTDVAMTETLAKNAGMVVVFLQNVDADQSTFMFTTGREDAIAHKYSLVTGSASNCTVSLSTNVFTISGMGDGRTYTLTMSTAALGTPPTLRASSSTTGNTDIIMYAVLAF